MNLFIYSNELPDDLLLSDHPDKSYQPLVAYQWENYTLLLKSQRNDIKAVRILINNKEVSIINYSSSFVFGAYEFNLTDIIRMSYGLVQIALVLELFNGSEEVLFSRPLVIAMQESRTDLEQSIEAMVEAILKKDLSLLSRTAMTGKFTGRTDYELETVEQLLNIYSRHYPYFSRDVHCAMRMEQKVGDFQKLKAVNAHTINYIATHISEFEMVQHRTGITLNNTCHVQPRKTLIAEQQLDQNTYENQVVVGMLYYLINWLKAKQEDISLSNPQFDLPVESGYRLTTSVINLYRKKNSEKHLKLIAQCLVNANRLLMQYRQIIKCPINLLTQMPRLTPAFQSKHHYRNVFSGITQFFNTCASSGLVSERQVLEFSTADEIYEYYCQLSIFETLTALGFVEDKDKRERYEYSGRDQYFFNPSDHDNTFYFEKGEERVVVYVQPMIYSWHCPTTNNISLYRTDRSFYTPDFIIKHDRPYQNTDYLILDSKWQDRGHIEGKMAEMYFKYMVKIADRQKTPGKFFFWLLQGKDDEAEKLSCLNHGRISQDDHDQFYQSGTVTLTPAIGNQYFTKVLDQFLV